MQPDQASHDAALRAFRALKTDTIIAVARLCAMVCGAAVAALVLACNALTGVGDLEAVDDAGSIANPNGDARSETSTGISSSGGASSSGGTDSGSDGESLVDGGADADAAVLPSCGSGRSCVPVTPPGWSGPFQIYTGSASSSVPDCPAVMPANDDFGTGTLTNTGFACECRCGGINGVTCTALLEEFNGSACADQAGEEDLAACRTPGGTDSSVTVNVNLAGNGSCTPNAGFKTKQDPDFATTLRYCHRDEDFTSDGCSANELCVPDGVAPFRTHACIFNDDASTACPAPWTQRVDTFDDVDDTRSCGNGSCGCNAPTNLGCTGTMRNYTASQSCAGAFDTVAIPFTTCLPVIGNSSQKLQTNSLRITGSCGVRGAPAPSGGVAGASAGIGCCIP